MLHTHGLHIRPLAWRGDRGRGEWTAYLASNGYRVPGLDISGDAVTKLQAVARKSED